MTYRLATLIAGGLLATTLFVAPASAQLGGVGDLVGKVVGGRDSGALVTITGGDADDSGLVNLGLGGDDGNIVDADVLPSVGGGVTANVSSGGSRGSVLGADVDVLDGTADVSADVLGRDSAVSADVGLIGGAVEANVDILGNGGGGGGNGGGGNGGGGNGGGGNGGGGIGGGGIGGGGNGGGGIGGGGSRGGVNFAGVNPRACVGADPFQALSLFQRTAVTNSAISAWHNIANVRIVPVQFCSPQRNQLQATLATSPKLPVLQTSAMSVPSISSALNGAGYRAHNVFAVARSAGQLTVYVY